MTLEIGFVLLVGLFAVILFITERLRVDVVALLVMVTFITTGVLTPTQGIAGFSNPATVTVAAMFVLAAALQRTGALDFVADMVLKLAGRSTFRAVLVLMITIAAVSAFINNTAAVAVFLPVTLELARRSGVSPSKLLIPLSFASLFGGACTLIGTSTNILVSTLAVQHGDRPIGMFELAPVGLVLGAVGLVYMSTVGLALLPSRRPVANLEESFEMQGYLTEVCLLDNCSSLGMNLSNAPLTQTLDVDVIEIQRGDSVLRNPDGSAVLMVADVLRVRCSLEALAALRTLPGVMLPLKEDEEPRHGGFLEAVIAPGSVLVGHTLKTINFRKRYRCTAVALRRHDRIQHSKLGNIRLRGGDVLLVTEAADGLASLRGSRDFVLVSKVEHYRKRRHLALPAVVILGVTVTLAALNVFPIVVASLLGCIGVVLAGALEPDEVYDAIDWSVIMLLGGMLTLGAAVQESGADDLLAGWLLSLAGDLGPWFLVAALYLCTSLLTEFLSNNATAVLLVPIAFAAADSLGVDARPFLIAITYAASASFMTPVGYQTNTLVYGPGQYRFSDYLKVGVPLNLLFWVVASLLIPRFWNL